MALTEKLTAVADSIRAKTGKEDLITLEEMPNEIGSISSLADIPDEAFVIDGDISLMTQHPTTIKLIKHFGNKFRTENLTKVTKSFQYADIEHIPFEINCKAGTAMSLENLFAYSKIKSVPKINNCKPNSLASMFSGCYYLSEIPEDELISSFDWSAIEGTTSTSIGSLSSFSAYCGALKKLPYKIYRKANPISDSYYVFYRYMATNCYRLDEIVDIPIPYTNDVKSNMFYYTFEKAGRAKRITFEMPDGKPKTVRWSNQTITLRNIYLGWIGASNEQDFLEYNKDITDQNKVTTIEQYNTLKNTPNWYTTSKDFSRYNHDSAVETINSLPDTSAYLAEVGGTNTITFYKDQASRTDGGACGNLTAEEIAVATEKGWTVSIY